MILLFGIIELIVYGVMLLLKKLFIVVCVFGGIGGVIIGFFGVKVFFSSLVSLLMILIFISMVDGVELNVIVVVIVIGIVFVLVFVGMLILGFDE